MNKVPDGKRVYIGARKFLSGEILPPFVILDNFGEMTKKQIDKLADKHEGQKRYRKRSIV